MKKLEDKLKIKLIYKLNVGFYMNQNP